MGYHELNNETDIRFLLDVNRLLLVEFYTDICPPCQKIKEEIKEMNEKGLFNKVALITVNAKNFPEIANGSLFQVRSVPVLFVLKGGQIIGKGSGLDEVKDLLYKYCKQDSSNL